MFRSAIVKLTAVCNIDCSYCYMFRQADQTYARMPARMSLPLALRLLDRVCAYHPPGADEAFSIVLHGGEPLLWPEADLLEWLRQFGLRRAQGWNLDLAIQTNLVRPLSGRLRDALHQARVALGVSLDGPRDLNDSVRVDKLGRGTYQRVMQNVESLLEHGDGDLIGGFLSVANPAMTPQAYLDWVLSLPITRVDVLWPIEFNWKNPPWGIFSRDQYAKNPRYGRWFSDLFMAWWNLDRPDIVIRLFDNLLRLMLGDKSHIDSLVNDSYNMFVVNTDGSYEYPDYLRNARDGAAQTSFNILNNAIEELHQDPVFYRLLHLKDECPSSCRQCRHQAVCGGGFLPGRSDALLHISSRESVLCADQMYFFDSVSAIVRQALQPTGGHHAVTIDVPSVMAHAR
jgi:uncharacterized protein